ncbi:MAG: hypothetical protein CK424_00860 [Legionella sp.]|nr:MAG: hypothetical protein CK424_00860 [Legionella sp.]
MGTNLLFSLRSDEEVRFGNAIVKDDSIILTKHKLFGANQSIRCFWHQIHYWSSDGNFYIGMKNDKNTFVCLSYLRDPNIRVLEFLIEITLKTPGAKLLSDVLNNND